VKQRPCQRRGRAAPDRRARSASRPSVLPRKS
jgi:hypothetical protein